MDKYFDVTFQLLSSLGLRIHGGDNGKLSHLLKIVTVAIPFTVSVQESMTVIFDASYVHKICEFPCLLIVLEAVVEVYNRHKISDLLSNLDKFYQDMSPSEKKSHEKFVGRYRQLALSFGPIAMLTVYSFNLLPLGRTLYSKYVDGEAVKYFPYYFWFPFDQFTYYATTYIYEVYCAHLMCS